LRGKHARDEARPIARRAAVSRSLGNDSYTTGFELAADIVERGDHTAPAEPAAKWGPVR